MGNKEQHAVQRASQWLADHQSSWNLQSRDDILYLQLPLPRRYGSAALVAANGAWWMLAGVEPDVSEWYPLGQLRESPKQVVEAAVIRLLTILIQAIPRHPEVMDGYAPHLHRLATAVRNDELAAWIIFQSAESHSPLAPANIAAQEAFRRMQQWASGRGVGWAPTTSTSGRPALVLPQPFSTKLSSWHGRWAVIYELPDGRNDSIGLVDFDEEPEALIFSAMFALIRLGKHLAESDPWDALSFAHAARDLVAWCRNEETDETWKPLERQALDVIDTLRLPNPTWRSARQNKSGSR